VVSLCQWLSRNVPPKAGVLICGLYSVTALRTNTVFICNTVMNLLTLSRTKDVINWSYNVSLSHWKTKVQDLIHLLAKANAEKLTVIDLLVMCLMKGISKAAPTHPDWDECDSTSL
jgi:hypothetical protein